MVWTCNPIQRSVHAALGTVRDWDPSSSRLFLSVVASPLWSQDLGLFLASLPKFWWLFLFLYFKLTNYLINLKVSPSQTHISEWEEWHRTFFLGKRSLLKITQVLKGWTDFLLGTELKDSPMAQLERTSSWLGQQNQCCMVPLWLQDAGSGWCGTVISAWGFEEATWQPECILQMFLETPI